MIPAEEVLDTILTADWIACKNPECDRLRILTSALYNCRLDTLTSDEHYIVLAAGELAKMRSLAGKLRATVPPCNNRHEVVTALNAAEDMVLACSHVPGVAPLLEDIQRLTAGIK